MGHVTKRAFSLVEVTVALSIGAIVMSVAFEVFVTARYTAMESAVRAQLARDAQLVIDVMGKDLASLGAGVPAGTCADASCSSGASLRPTIRRALDNNLVFLGDAPFPNADLPGIVTIARFNNDADSTDIAISSELNGGCTPHAGAGVASPAYRCSTTAASMLVTPSPLVAADACYAGNEGARTCPWALKKWQLNGNPTLSAMNLVALMPSGNFVSRRWTGAWATVNNYRGVRLVAATSGPATLTRSAFYPSATAGGASLVSLDRIFYALEDASGGSCTTDCILKRRQCWGLVDDPEDNQFPDEGTAFVGSTDTIRNCAAPSDGTAWETLATGVESLHFTYYQAQTELPAPVSGADLGNIRAIDVDLVLKIDAPGRGPVLRQSMHQRFFLANRDRSAP